THPPPSDYVSDPDQPLAAHIDNLWDVLTRHPRQHRPYSSLLPLPRPYVVPGGRFGELYYWDSYFTMLGLAESGRHDLLRAMADNFAWLIDCYGHVPNGNRSYYLSRSQPPVFALMVELFEVHGVSEAVRYLPRLRREHAFWMEGSEGLEPGEARRHCACMPDGSVLNRYWDELARPREEEYLEDVTTAASQSARPAEAVYRDLRAAAGTTSIVPVDLNAFLFALEEQIADLSRKSGDEATAAHFGRLCRARAEAIERWLWDDRAGAYFDYDLLRDGIRSHRLCAAAA